MDQSNEHLYKVDNPKMSKTSSDARQIRSICNRHFERAAMEIVADTNGSAVSHNLKVEYLTLTARKHAPYTAELVEDMGMYSVFVSYPATLPLYYIVVYGLGVFLMTSPACADDRIAYYLGLTGGLEVDVFEFTDGFMVNGSREACLIIADHEHQQTRSYVGHGELSPFDGSRYYVKVNF